MIDEAATRALAEDGAARVGGLGDERRPFQMYKDARRHAAAHGLPSIDRNSSIRDQGSPLGLFPEGLRASTGRAWSHSGTWLEHLGNPVFPRC